MKKSPIDRANAPTGRHEPLVDLEREAIQRRISARLFGELVVSDVSRRLVEVFFATTALKKENGTADASVKAREVKKIAVLGGEVDKFVSPSVQRRLQEKVRSLGGP